MSQMSVVRGSDTWIGLMLILAVVASAAFAWFGSADQAEGPQLTAIYSNGIGLEVGDPVTLRGLVVGEGESDGGAKHAAVVVGETHPFAGEAVDVWRLHDLLPVTAEHSGAEVIGEDEDDVGAVGLGPKGWR